MEKKEVMGISMQINASQTRARGSPLLEGRSYGHRLSIRKREVFMFKEGKIWEKHCNFRYTASKKSRPLRTVLSKNHSDPKLDTALESIKKSCVTFQSDVQNICIL